MSLFTLPIDDTLLLNDMASPEPRINVTPINENMDRVAIVQPIRQTTSNSTDSDNSLIDTSKPLQRTTYNIPGPRNVPCKAILVVAVLTLVNLLNYMDRFTIAGRKKIKLSVSNHNVGRTKKKSTLSNTRASYQ